MCCDLYKKRLKIVADNDRLLDATTLIIKTLSIMTFSLTTLNIRSYYVTLSISDS